MKKLYIPLIIFSCSFLLLITIFADIIAEYFPSGDEISLIVNSCGSYNADISKWFSNGFYGYFTPYPEWNESMKTILRPVVNLVFFTNDFFFRSNYGLYLLFTYLVHSISCAFVYIICIEYLKLRYVFGVSAAALMFINPAVTNPDFFFHPGFAMDALVSVFFFLCFYILTKEKKYYFILYISVIFALFTKEISILLCFLLPVTFYLKFGKKSLIPILYVLLIFIFYCFIRSASGFETFSDSSLDHFKSIKDFSFSVFKAILVYPAGFYSVNDISRLYREFYFSDASIVIAVIFFLIPEILNIGPGLILFFKRKFLAKAGVINFRILLIWNFFIALYLILMSLDLRFAYTFYLFFIPLLFSLFKLEKKYKIFAALFLIGFLISNIIKFTSVLNPYKEKNLAKYKLSRQLADEMKKIDNDFPVILINDVSALFGSGSLSRFCGKNNDVVKLNSLDFPGKSERYKSLSEVKINRDTALTISIKNISNRFQFEGVSKNFNHTPAVEFYRNDTLSYFFPEERLKKITSKGKNVYDFGTSLQVRIRTKTQLNLLYFNENETKYSFIKY